MTGRAAIELRDVTKRYQLYGGPIAQALGYLGLTRQRGPFKVALDSVSLTIGHGEKVGVIGRNGSGKTTLLRLVIDHTQPTAGTVETDGTVQAMMQTGFGFNDELSGFENIDNALVYNGLDTDARAAAVADIEDFVELGEFLAHPIKTYSLGMRARLEFATATAIRPDILAIDEVLGAGDGYFVRKCAERMKDVVSDSTLLLVSHSLEQVDEYCERVIWLDAGGIVADGPVREVIKDYQQFMSREEARIQQRIRARDEGPAGDGGDEPAANAALTKARGLFRLPANPPLRIIDATIERSDHATMETGQPLTVEIDCEAQAPVAAEPVMLGMTEHGAFLFEAVGNCTVVESRRRLQLATTCAGIGVGNYFLIAAFRDSHTKALLAIADRALALKVLPTNWSDPPLVHLEADWRDRDGRSLKPKVSAWV